MRPDFINVTKYTGAWLQSKTLPAKECTKLLWNTGFLYFLKAKLFIYPLPPYITQTITQSWYKMFRTWINLPKTTTTLHERGSWFSWHLESMYEAVQANKSVSGSHSHNSTRELVVSFNMDKQGLLSKPCPATAPMHHYSPLLTLQCRRWPQCTITLHYWHYNAGGGPGGRQPRLPGGATPPLDVDSGGSGHRAPPAPPDSHH